MDRAGVNSKTRGTAQAVPSVPGRADEGGPLDRYVTVLEVVAAFPDAVTMIDICSLLELPKTTVHRLLGGLARAGLVEGGGRNRTFSLGSRLVRLMHSSAEEGWLAALAREPLETLAAERNETCYLARLVGHRTFIVARESPEPQWRHYVQPGYVMSPHAAAAAKAILAFQAEAIIARALDEPLPKLTAQTLTDPRAIREEYAKVKATGYATCISEIDEGFGALSVPVVQANGDILHSVGITGPVQRIMDADMPARVESLRNTASQLSRPLSLGSTIAGRLDRRLE